ncbi:MAG: molecular chaperone Hsp33 [Motiliproteus sp.]|jgi:molecular chaperone Hsp33
MSSTDQLQRFIFDDADVRGVLVGLDKSYQQTLDRHDYPVPVRRLLGEMLAAVALLSATLKFEGRLSLQVRGDGPLSMLMSECTHQNHLRGIARIDGVIDDVIEGDTLLALFGQGQLIITIEPDQGKRYQGIVPLDQPDLARCLEQYFAHSEQLATRIMLCADGQRAAGMLLQALPSNEQEHSFAENWNRISHLGATLSDQELLELDNETLLFRLFHEEEVRLYEPSELVFKCHCSKDRCLKALRTLADTELDEMLDERGSIEMDCQFCNSRYQIDSIEVEQMRHGVIDSGSDQLH